MRHGETKQRQHFDEGLAAVVSQAQGTSSPLEVHSDLERLRIAVEDDMIRYAIKLSTVYQHSTEEVIAKVGKLHGRDLKSEYGANFDTCQECQCP